MRFWVFLTACFFLIPTLAWPVPPQNKYSQSTRIEKKELKKRIEKIEIFHDTPNRPFKRITPVWSTSMVSMERAMKGLKKQAAKAGADAIIEVKIGTQSSEIVTGSAGSWGGVIGGGSSPQPVVQGWAIKWIDEEE